MNRRPLLKLLAGAAFVAAGGAGTFAAWSRRNYLYRRFVRHAPGRATGTLTDDELRHVIALAEVVYPPADEQQNRLLREVVVSWAAARTEQDGLLPTYREGVGVLQRHAQGADPVQQPSYCDVSRAERDSIVRQVMLSSEEDSGDSDGWGGIDDVALLWNRDHWRLRYLIEDLEFGIYSSALGWSVVGYATWPGVPAGPLEYTRPPPSVDDAL